MEEKLRAYTKGVGVVGRLRTVGPGHMTAWATYQGEARRGVAGEKGEAAACETITPSLEGEGCLGAGRDICGSMDWA